jgi:MFS family permease
MTQSVSSPRTPAFLLAFALANAGGVLAYLPFLSLLLPLKVEAMAGADRVTVLSAVLAGGAIAAGAGNILVGLAIDRSVARVGARNGFWGGGLRPWIAAGMVATALSFALILAAHTPAALFLAVIAFELALNVMIAPVAMVLVNDVPDAQKGLAGGLLTLGQPMAMLAGTVLVPLYERSEAGAYGAIGLGICLLALPIVATRAQSPSLPVALSPKASAVADLPGMARGDLTWLMLSRLLLLTANCILGVILIYYFENLLQGLTAGAVARRVGVVSVIAYVVAVPIAVVLGAKTVNRARRKAFAMAAALVAGGTVVMIVLAPRWEWAAIGYALFVCTLQVYTSQHSALVAQALRRPRHRARDLGYQNLANTVPAVIAPMIVVAVYRYAAMPALIWTMAGLALASVIALSRVRVD